MATNKYVSLDKLSHFLLKLKELIPTKTSDLTNDSNYVSDANYVHTDTNFTQIEKDKLDGIAEGANNYELPKATADTLGGVKIGANITVAADGTITVTAMEWENINGRPTKLSEFTNDSNFITNAVSDLTNYYTKANTYTKTEIDNKISALKTISIQVVASLPATGESNVIYLVPKTGTGTDVHDEYVWVAANSKFEKIGSTDIDLSGYWKKTDLTECTNDEIDTLFA